MSATYDPLPPGKHIRLLELRTDKSSQQLVYTFIVVSLDYCKHQFTAISYAWEDPAPVDSINSSDGLSLTLSVTISNLFHSLRKRRETFILWLDALCINQENTEEKSSQVRLMGDIYSSAERVLVWLGVSTPKAESAFRFMESKQSFSWPHDWDTEEDLSGLETVFDLLDRPWFRRLWVIQEVTLNDDVLIGCGDDLLDFATFRSCIFAFWKFFENLSDYDYDHPAVLGLWSVTRLIWIQDEFRASGRVRYETLLQQALHCETTDERDKVFAFRGIGDDERPVPGPDYTASVEHIYTDTAVALLCHGKSLDLLALSGIGKRPQTSELPTWVPDLRYQSFEEPFNVCDSADWNAGGHLVASPGILSRNQIRLQVNAFDYVELTCAAFNVSSVTDQQEAVRGILALRQKLPYEVSEETWLDTVASTLIFGLDLEDEIASPEYRELFNEWLHWLQTSHTEEDLQNIRTNKYYRTLDYRIDGWKAFMTRRGFLCIGPPEVGVGDEVCVVPGCRLPLVLRSIPKTSVTASLPEYLVVSWCFAQGVMHGEARSMDLPMIDVLLQ